MAQRLARNMLRNMMRASRASRAPDHRHNPSQPPPVAEPQYVRLPLTRREILKRHLLHERMTPSIFIAEIQDF
jgi:hypothetical protein